MGLEQDLFADVPDLFADIPAQPVGPALGPDTRRADLERRMDAERSKANVEAAREDSRMYLDPTAQEKFAAALAGFSGMIANPTDAANVVGAPLPGMEDMSTRDVRQKRIADLARMEAGAKEQSPGGFLAGQVAAEAPAIVAGAKPGYLAFRSLGRAAVPVLTRAATGSAARGLNMAAAVLEKAPLAAGAAVGGSVGGPIGAGVGAAMGDSMLSGAARRGADAMRASALRLRPAPVAPPPLPPPARPEWMTSLADDAAAGPAVAESSGLELGAPRLQRAPMPAASPVQPASAAPSPSPAPVLQKAPVAGPAGAVPPPEPPAPIAPAPPPMPPPAAPEPQPVLAQAPQPAPPPPPPPPRAPSLAPRPRSRGGEGQTAAQALAGEKWKAAGRPQSAAGPRGRQRAAAPFDGPTATGPKPKFSEAEKAEMMNLPLDVFDDVIAGKITLQQALATQVTK